MGVGVQTFVCPPTLKIRIVDSDTVMSSRTCACWLRANTLMCMLARATPQPTRTCACWLEGGGEMGGWGGHQFRMKRIVKTQKDSNLNQMDTQQTNIHTFILSSITKYSILNFLIVFDCYFIIIIVILIKFINLKVYRNILSC